MSKLLINEPPLQVLPSLAAKIGLNEAIFLQQLHYWLQTTKHHRDGKPWVYNTVAEWVEQFPFWSVPTLRRIINSLREMGIVEVTSKYNKMPIDKTFWYTIDYGAIPNDENDTRMIKLITSNDQLDHMERSDCALVNDQVDHTNNQRLPETTTETTDRESEASASPPAPRTIPARNGASKQKRIESPHIPPDTRFENGFIPAGHGVNAVQVYYERFDITEDAARLKARQEDDLIHQCTDLERLREVVTAYSQTNYRPGNLRLILDWYHGGVPNRAPNNSNFRNGANHATHRSNGSSTEWRSGNDARETEPEFVPDEEFLAAVRRSNELRRQRAAEAGH